MIPPHFVQECQCTVGVFNLKTRSNYISLLSKIGHINICKPLDTWTPFHKLPRFLLKVAIILQFVQLHSIWKITSDGEFTIGCCFFSCRKDAPNKVASTTPITPSTLLLPASICTEANFFSMRDILNKGEQIEQRGTLGSPPPPQQQQRRSHKVNTTMSYPQQWISPKLCKEAVTFSFKMQEGWTFTGLLPIQAPRENRRPKFLESAKKNMKKVHATRHVRKQMTPPSTTPRGWSQPISQHMSPLHTKHKSSPSTIYSSSHFSCTWLRYHN